MCFIYQKPYSINESLWRLPDDRNVRWSNYQCKNFECLSSKNPKQGYSKCIGCFEMEKEKLKWVTNSSLHVDFLINDVLAIKPGLIRIGLDFGYRELCCKDERTHCNNCFNCFKPRGSFQ